jgi:hypothetical protein
MGEEILRISSAQEKLRIVMKGVRHVRKERKRFILEKLGLIHDLNHEEL